MGRKKNEDRPIGLQTSLINLRVTNEAREILNNVPKYNRGKWLSERVSSQLYTRQELNTYASEKVKEAISQMQSEWMEINSVEDLPTEEGQFYVHQKVWYEPFFQINTFSGRLTNAVIDGKPIFSHYMKVVLPQPPAK